MKLEVLVSDDQAQRLVNLLLEHASLPSDQPLLQELLQKEVESAGPDAHDLFERIVIAVERSLITHVYAECNGVKTRAATRLGINRNTLHKKLRDYGLDDHDAA
jgi:DNA-binding protein Fis